MTAARLAATTVALLLTAAAPAVAADIVNPQITDVGGAAPLTTVNGQITDAITQTNVKILGDAPAMAMGSLYQTIGNSVAMAAANAVYAQQQANVTFEASTSQGVGVTYAPDTIDTSGCGTYLTAALLVACAAH